MKGCVNMTNGINKLAESVANAIHTVPELYNDALKPSAIEAGKTAALLLRTINAALSPLEIWVLNKEYNVAETKKLLALKLENISPDKIVTPEPYVAVPAIQAISYAMNSEELRDLYANLIAKSMNIDTKDTVHPAYIETIKQLSPDDAKYFKHIYSLDIRPMVDTLLTFPNSLIKKVVQNSNTFSKNYTNNFPLSIDNLSRLGLINIPDGVWYGDDSIYELLINYLKTEFTLESYKSDYPDAQGIIFSKKRIDITDYGHNFFNTCVI
jgi:hypothetical protein